MPYKIAVCLSRRVVALRLHVTIVLAFITSLSANAQTTHLSVDNGLSENSVNCIYQDRQGFMWFGTRGGLNKYDGYSIQRFVHDSRNNSSLSSNYITSILQPHSELPENERRTILWIGTDNGGLNKFDTHTGKCKRFLSDSTDATTLSDNGIKFIFEDSRGTIWIGTVHGLNRLNRESQAFTRYPFPFHKEPCNNYDNFHAVCEDAEGNLWFATQFGLNKLEPGSQLLKRFLIAPADSTQHGENDLVSVCVMPGDATRKVWVVTNTGRVEIFDAKKESFETFSRLPVSTPSRFTWGPVSSMYLDDGKILWSGFADGSVIRLDVHTAEFTRLTFEPKMVHPVRTILRDRSGLLWIGSGGDGVNIVQQQDIHFSLYKHSRSRSILPGDDAVWSLLQASDGRIWVGTDNGMCILDEAKKEFADYIPPKREYPVRAIVERDSSLWLGVLDHGLARLNIRTRVVTTLKNPSILPNGDEDNLVYALYEDTNNILWIGTNVGGLTALDPSTNRFQRFPTIHEAVHPNWWVLAIHEDARYFWLGTWSDGLLRFDKRSYEMRYTFDYGKTPQLSESRVLCVTPDPLDTNILWLGTYGGGLNRYDKSSGMFTSFTQHNGLPDNTVYSVLADEFTNLWLGTNNGLCRFDTRTHAVRNFTVADGLQSNEFNVGPALRTRDGRMFFGGHKGLNSFRPVDNINRTPPSVVITGIKKFGVRVDFDEQLSVMNAIPLSHSDNSIAFEFVALHFKDPVRNQYAAMLEGYDQSWQSLGAQREALYTDLPPGEYTFKVKAANTEGVWSEPTSLAVIIAPPFWKAWWFLAGVPMSLAFFVLVARFNRVRRDREQHRRILANVHDKGGAILSTLKVQTEAARQDLRTNSPIAEKTLEDVTKLIDELALGVRQSTWLQDPTLSSLQDLALHLASFGGKLFDRADIAFSLAPLPEASEHLRLSMRWREELLCIFQEAMNNAARHAKGCTNVVLTFTREGRRLSASLIDDGVGFNRESLLRINGLQNMEWRVALLKGSLAVGSVDGRGTRIELTARLPLWVVVSTQLRTIYSLRQPRNTPL